uniref:Zinc finger PHD-type domain-containing protein n=1 Tax=Anopheles albimanus TaxID=7167 RepID=A0A182FC46_ANOAL
MVQCDDCDRWFHQTCAGLERLPEAHEPYLCVKCALINDQLRKKVETKHRPADMRSDVLDLLERLIEALSVRGNDQHAKRAALMKLPEFEGRARARLAALQAHFKGVSTVNTMQLPAQGLDVAKLPKYPHLRDVPLASHLLMSLGYTKVHEEAEMNRMIARYFTTEDLGVKPAGEVESEDVATARKTLEQTLVGQEGPL